MNSKPGEKMSLFEKIKQAAAQKDADKWIGHYHPDFQFVRHQTGTTMNRDQIYGMIKSMFTNDAVVQSDHRCIYENDQVLIEHSVMDFPDNSREAVLVVHLLKDGKIFRSETGATPINTLV